MAGGVRVLGLGRTIEALTYYADADGSGSGDGSRDLVRFHCEGAIGMRSPIDCEHTLSATMEAS